MIFGKVDMIIVQHKTDLLYYKVIRSNSRNIELK